MTMNNEWRRSWKKAVMTSASACQDNEETMKSSRFESKPVLLTYIRTRTFLL
jgi:hypothetical protein